VAPDEDENTYIKPSFIAKSPTILWLDDVAILSIHSVILRIPVSFTGRRDNLIHPLRHSEERIMRRENLILKSIYEE